MFHRRLAGRERGRDLVDNGLGVALEANEVAAHAGLDVAVLPADAVVLGSCLDLGHVLEDGEELCSGVPVAVRDMLLRGTQGSHARCRGEVRDRSVIFVYALSRVSRLRIFWFVISYWAVVADLC